MSLTASCPAPAYRSASASAPAACTHPHLQTTVEQTLQHGRSAAAAAAAAAADRYISIAVGPAPAACTHPHLQTNSGTEPAALKGQHQRQQQQTISQHSCWSCTSIMYTSSSAVSGVSKPAATTASSVSPTTRPKRQLDHTTLWHNRYTSATIE
jgi:hypothetical protein